MRGYFNGLYFKHQNEAETLAIIPALHRDRNGIQTASIQVITDDQSFYIPYPVEKYRSYDPVNLMIDKNHFSRGGIELDICTGQVEVKGSLEFGPFTPLPTDIMGPFQYLPLMQCRHSVFSMQHSVNGTVEVNGRKYHFQNGLGYVEGDRGNSFPEQYLWTQSQFPGGSLMLSVASIPVCGCTFTGIIGVIMVHQKQLRLATYYGAKLKEMNDDEVTVEQGEYTFTARLIKENGHRLHAPADGNMSRFIRESPSGTASYCLKKGGRTLLEVTSEQAGFEFEY